MANNENPLVEVVHATLGKIKRRKKFVDLVLETNHIKNSGSWCGVDEVSKYFDELPQPKATKKRRRVVKKTETPEE